MDAFIAVIEVNPREESILGEEDVSGAFVRCYIPAPSCDDALERLHQALYRDGLDLVEVDFCESYFWTDWENADDGSDEAGANEALATGDVVYGTFNTW
jgi:hypothetical protein